MTTTRKRLVVGTRGSALALRQTQEIVDQLKGLYPDMEILVEVRRITTEGDRRTDVPLVQIAGQGVFVKEIETALLAGEIDIAVHSLKDMTSSLDDGLFLASVSQREDPRDVLVSHRGETIDQLSPGSRIGTGSIRRTAQVKAYRPDLIVEGLRGNTDTRLRRAQEGAFDAIVLAAAGILRLDREDAITQYLPYDFFLPAVGQGALAVEARADDYDVLKLLEPIDHKSTRVATTAERAFLRTLGGGCLVPIAALGRVNGSELELRGMVCVPDGTRVYKDIVVGSAVDPERLGEQLADRLLSMGAGEVLEEYRDTASPDPDDD